MTAINYSTEACSHFAPPTYFQPIFAAFCVLMTNPCIFLFFLVLASKLLSLLIRVYATHTNRIQREFDSNGAITTFDHEPFTPENKPSQTRRAFTLRRRYEIGKSNRILREFLFNNCIQSHSRLPTSSHPRQKINLRKPSRANLALLSLSAKIVLYGSQRFKIQVWIGYEHSR
jgi:hypothetical protein